MAPRRLIKRGSPPNSASSSAEPQLSHPGSAGLLALPPELLEDILVLLSGLGYPTTISALARTCQPLKQLIYAPQDKFLWRRIFLTTFDDPRSVQTDTHVDWALTYQARIKASLCIEHHRDSVVEKKDDDDRQHSPRRLAKAAPATFKGKRRTSHSSDSPVTFHTDYTTTLQTLLSILDTAHPITWPAHELSKQLWENPSLIALSLREAAIRAPSMPPRLTTSPPEVPDAVSTAATDGESDRGSVEVPSIVPPSKNLAYIKHLLSGVVPELASRLSTARATPWQSTPEAQAFNRLVATFGPAVFLQPPADEGGTVYRRAIYANENSELGEAFRKIRHAAQKKVYDMGYLSRRRAWGPFLRVRAEKGPRGDVVSVASSDDDDEDEYHPLPERTPSDSSEEVESDDEDYVPPHARHPAGPRNPPGPEELCADWEHLAAIRVVVQAKLEEKLLQLQADFGQWFEPGSVEEVLWTLLGWENVRAGVWTGVRARREGRNGGVSVQMETRGAAVARGGSGETVSSAQILKSPGDPPTEWDWAGVEGVWRRAVCWLDYHDLIYNNSRGFRTPDLEEATITVPLALHITGFAPSPIPEYKDFPTIHFDSRRYPTIHVEGTMGGADWAFNGGAQEDVRRIRGTVRVCRDGSVWWSMGSPTEWEWASEGVQIGAALGAGGPIGVRSGCGILGLWTGWEHEVEDPIGAWWQWKVA